MFVKLYRCLYTLINSYRTQLSILFFKEKFRIKGRPFLIYILFFIANILPRKCPILFVEKNIIYNIYITIKNSFAYKIKTQNLCSSLLDSETIAIDCHIFFPDYQFSNELLESEKIYPYFETMIEMLMEKAMTVFIVFPDNSELPNLGKSAIIPIWRKTYLLMNKRKTRTTTGTIILPAAPMRNFFFFRLPVSIVPCFFNDPLQLEDVICQMSIDPAVKKVYKELIFKYLLCGTENMDNSFIAGFLLAGPILSIIFWRLLNVRLDEPDLHILLTGDMALFYYNVMNNAIEEKYLHIQYNNEATLLSSIPSDSRYIYINTNTEKQEKSLTSLNLDIHRQDEIKEISTICIGAIDLLLRNKMDDMGRFLDGMELFANGYYQLCLDMEHSMSSDEERFWIQQVCDYLEIVRI